MRIDFGIPSRMKLDHGFIVPPEKVFNPIHLFPSRAAVGKRDRNVLPSSSFRVTVTGSARQHLERSDLKRPPVFARPAFISRRLDPVVLNSEVRLVSHVDN